MGRLSPLGESAPVAGGRDLFVPGDGVRLAATRWTGTGTPVLLLHGLASQRRFWNLVVPYLAGLPVVALDQRGHGDSDPPDGRYDDTTVVADVTTALDALGLSRVVAVGHSWGGNVAMELAASHPERVLAAIALDGGVTTPSHSMSREEAHERLAPPRIAVPPEELLARLRDGSFGVPWSSEVAAAVLPIFGVGADGLARARLAYEDHMKFVDALYDYDPDAVLPRIAVPVWVAIAMPLAQPDNDLERDWAALKRAAQERVAGLLKRPRLLSLGGAMHDVPLQWPALVAGIVRAAVDEVAPGGGP